MQSAGERPAGSPVGRGGEVRAARRVPSVGPSTPGAQRFAGPHPACRLRRCGALASVYRARCASAIPAARDVRGTGRRAAIRRVLA